MISSSSRVSANSARFSVILPLPFGSKNFFIYERSVANIAYSSIRWTVLSFMFSSGI
jgi:hypothetical protein